MRTATFNFSYAYDSYYRTLKGELKQNMSVLELGGGAHPTIQDREGINYFIVDPDFAELDKAPSDITKIIGTVQELDKSRKYDLIISKMVLEHVEDPDTFHKSVFELLKSNGRAIHFFAGRHSLPALVNRMLPENVGDGILKLLKNRDLGESPKYEAYYRRTRGHTDSQINYFQRLGYQVESYSSFVGHKYLDSIPIFGYLEKLYTNFLAKMNIKQFATVALVILKKK